MTSSSTFARNLDGTVALELSKAVSYRIHGIGSEVECANTHKVLRTF